MFYDGDGRGVHCGIDLDDAKQISTASIDGALDRAAARNETVELYAHNPGVTVQLATIEHVLAGARDRGLAFVTYGDFARGDDVRPAVALSFDDTSVDSWVDALPLFATYAARVTFFVSRSTELAPAGRAQLHRLAEAGHDIAAHTIHHLRAPDYVEAYGLDAYLADEVRPSIDDLRRDGFEVTAFAYPFGVRTAEIDEAVLAQVPIVRSVSFVRDGVANPCPR